MRSLCCWLGMFLFAAVGCRTSAPDLKPPPQKEEYNVPPPNDPHYDKPYDYQKDINSGTPSLKGAGGQPVQPVRGPRMPGMSPGGF
jgi:hypothetical protein